MRLPVLAASLTVLLSQACLAEDFSIFSVNSKTGLPQINLAIDRDSISHYNDLIAYRIRWYNPYSNTREIQTTVANCATRHRGRRQGNEAIDTVSLYSVYPGTLMATELDIACGVMPSPNLAAVAEISNRPLAASAAKSIVTSDQVKVLFDKAISGDAAALADLKLAAEQGNTAAQLTVGNMYLYHRGVPFNFLEAMKWIAKAVPDTQQRAKAGDASAQLILGDFYLNGWGLAQDMLAAEHWWRAASDQGNMPARASLAMLYTRGNTRGPNPVPQDYPAAVRLSREAAEAGNADAQYLLASLYEKGNGVAQDDTAALAWYLKAANQGYLGAQYPLGMIYLKGNAATRQDFTQAAKWLLLAAQQGNGNAAFEIGELYYKGQGVAQDDVEAAKWLRKAAETVYEPKAKARLAQMYREGWGVPKDAAEADKWQKLADKPIQAVTNMAPPPSAFVRTPGKTATVDLNGCKPAYPRSALLAEEAGKVRIAFTVGADDQLLSSQVSQSSGYADLDQATLTSLSLCKFKAAIKDGKPVQSSFTAEYVWALDTPPAPPLAPAKAQ